MKNLTDEELERFIHAAQVCDNTLYLRIATELQAARQDVKRLDFLTKFFRIEPLHVAPEDTEYRVSINDRLFTNLRFRAVQQSDATLRAAIDASLPSAPERSQP